MPRQVRFAFDDRHAIGGSQHQKIVVVDDALAFCGGIDLTGHRWDTSAHCVEEPARVNAAGSPYGPYHEVQAMVSGPVAASLGTLARHRWEALGETMPPVAPGSLAGLWPDSVEPDLTDIDVAIARTLPPTDTDPGIRECEQLFVDSIAAARHAIYIESQYFTNDSLARALAARLQEPEGPEILLVIPQECHGWLEQETMGALRDQALRHLIDADRWRRLRVVYPAASCARGVATFVHSKVMIVDDRFVRIGSANFSRRSMGVDSECDLAIDAGSNMAHRAGVRRIRDRLIGEHLGMSADAVAGELVRAGSLFALVDARTHADRTLCRVKLHEPTEPPSEALKAAADPDEPVDVLADTGFRKAWRRVRSLGDTLWSLVPVRLLPSTARRRRADAEFG
jgi:phosphatidylserine/phosphatidylglycerophosphate/cardiolipin synthase-like enzyme